MTMPIIPSAIPENVESLRTPEAVLALEINTKLRSLKCVANAHPAPLSFTGQRVLKDLEDVCDALRRSEDGAAEFARRVLRELAGLSAADLSE